MIRKIEYYFLNHFCPVDILTEKSLEELKKEYPAILIEKHNLLEIDSELIAHFYFKINDEFFFTGPLFSLDIFKQFHLNGQLPEKQAGYSKAQVFNGDLTYVSYGEAPIKDFCFCCSPSSERKVRRKEIEWKTEWINGSEARSVEADGIVGYFENKPVCAIEWLNLRKIKQHFIDDKTKSAFIVCCYPGEGKIDHRAPLIKQAFYKLRENNYQNVYIISGEVSVYPNGPLSFFQNAGFEIVKKLPRAYFTVGSWENIFLLKKELR